MKIRKFLTFVLVVVTMLSCFAFGACNDKKDDGKNSGVVSDKYIVKEGFSDYYIVLPKKPQEKESFAAQELSYIIKEASGCTLPIINEKEVKSNYKYISLGKTLQFSDNFGDADLSALNGTQSAYYISTKTFILFRAILTTVTVVYTAYTTYCTIRWDIPITPKTRYTSINPKT